MMTRRQYSSSDIEQMPQRYRAEFVNCLSGFKSANLIGSRSADGVDNLAIVNSVVHIGAHPPLLGMVMRPHTVQRDTLENIKTTGVYTINNITPAMTAPAHWSSARFDASISEFEAVGLSPMDSGVINAPYVADSTIQLSMEVQDIQFLAINQTELVIGQIVEVVLPEEYVDKTGYIDIERCGSIAISGLVGYHKTLQIARYAYAKPDQPVNNQLQEDGDIDDTQS